MTVFHTICRHSSAGGSPVPSVRRWEARERAGSTEVGLESAGLWREEYQTLGQPGSRQDTLVWPRLFAVAALHSLQGIPRDRDFPREPEVTLSALEREGSCPPARPPRRRIVVAGTKR
jgi:hypothetical protein